MSKSFVELGLSVDAPMLQNVQSIIQANLQFLESFPSTRLKLVSVLFETGTKELLIEGPSLTVDKISTNNTLCPARSYQHSS